MDAPENICGTWAWHLGGKKAEWQNFVEARHYLYKQHGDYQGVDKEKQYVILVNDHMAIRDMLYYAQKHPEIRIADGSQTLYHFVARDLAKSNELIEKIEYPNGRIPAVWSMESALRLNEKKEQPMRLAEEDLIAEINRGAFEQQYKDRHNPIKQFVACTKNYIKNQIFCFEILSSFGDGSGDGQLTDKVGTVTVGQCSTKDVIDTFKQIIYSGYQKTETAADTQKLDSINATKTLRLATALRAFQLKGKDGLSTTQIDSTAQANSGSATAPTLIMQPSINTQQKYHTSRISKYYTGHHAR